MIINDHLVTPIVVSEKKSFFFLLEKTENTFCCYFQEGKKKRWQIRDNKVVANIAKVASKNSPQPVVLF